jgi:NAD+ diphosphatase
MLKPTDYALIFKGDNLLATKNENPFIIPFLEISISTLNDMEYFFLGTFEGKKIYAISNAQTEIENHEILSSISVRDALMIADSKTAQLISSGKQLLHWHRSSIYSGCCGAKTSLSETETAKVCQACNKLIYPTIAPVVIVLIERETQVLLARSPHFSKGVYSTIAGFINPGESAESAIHREVKEEVGIEIKNISYFKSQAWPFQSSLMLGFRAEYADGEIHVDGKEIEDAKWFNISSLPPLPHLSSISRQMIDEYITKKSNSSRNQS